MFAVPREGRPGVGPRAPWSLVHAPDLGLSATPSAVSASATPPRTLVGLAPSRVTFVPGLLGFTG